MRENRKIQQDNKEEPLSFNVKCSIIGFFGGLICSVIGYMAYLLNFMAFGPALVLSPWVPYGWKNEVTGHVIGILIIAVLSILTAFVYKILFAKWYTIWAGIIYGAAIWTVVFYLFNPIFPNLKPVGDFSVNTVVTTICLYILYGLFIGYSISFEYHELNHEQNKGVGGNPS